MGARRGEHTGLWGPYLAAAQLPNVSDATVQSRFVRKGDIGTVIVSGVATVYACTTATVGSGVWSEIHYAAKELTLTGGLGQATAISGVVNHPIVSATGGTDVSGADGTQYVTSIFLPVNMTITGVAWLIATGGTDKHYVVLYDADGTVVANSSVATDGVVVGTSANLDETDFTGTYAAVGPAMYYVGVSIKSTSAGLRTLPAYLGGSCFANSVSQTHGTVANITPPTTFTADKGPYVILY